MTPISVAYQLPFVAVTIHVNNQSLRLEHVLLDTGSVASIFKTDDLQKLGVEIHPEDRIRHMSGIGGSEPVIEKQISTLEVGELVASPFIIQMGALDYGIPMDGILGFDFLLEVSADINLRTLTVS